MLISCDEGLTERSQFVKIFAPLPHRRLLSRGCRRISTPWCVKSGGRTCTGQNFCPVQDGPPRGGVGGGVSTVVRSEFLSNLSLSDRIKIETPATALGFIVLARVLKSKRKLPLDGKGEYGYGVAPSSGPLLRPLKLLPSHFPPPAPHYLSISPTNSVG